MSHVPDDETPLQPSTAQSEPLTTSSTVDVPSGALYVAHGAVTARALAGAVADRDPRRRAYLRHVVLTALLFVAAGVGVVIAAAALF